jgi:hypothetical protein
LKKKSVEIYYLINCENHIRNQKPRKDPMPVRKEEIPEESSNTPMAIRLDMLQDIIEDLNANTKLQKLFGTPVTESLMMVADQFDLRIEYAGDAELTDKESELLVSILEILESKIP